MRNTGSLLLTAVLIIVFAASPAHADYNPFAGDDEYMGIPVPVFSPVDFSNVRSELLQVKPGSTQLKDNISFTDVDNHWAEPYVVNMAAQSVVRGYGEHRFRPNDPVSRQEAIALLVRIMGREAQVQQRTGTGFTRRAGDYILDLWAAGYIDEAQTLGIVTMSDSGNWKDSATREEVGVWFARALNLQPVYGSSQQAIYDFKDWKDIKVENLPYIEAIVQRGVMQGSDTGYFNPGASIKRSEIAVMLDKVAGDFHERRNIAVERGMVLSQGDTLGIIRTDGSFIQTDISREDFPVFRGGQVMYASQLIPGDEIELVRDGSGVFFARAVNDGTIAGVIDNLDSIRPHYGRIIGISTQQDRTAAGTVERTYFRVMDIDGGIYELVSEKDADTGDIRDIGVYRQGGNGTSGLLKSGDTIRYVVLDNRNIIYVNLMDGGENTAEGYVQKIEEGNRIEIKDMDGLSRIYAVMDNAEVIMDGRPAELTDLKYGQWVEMVISGGIATKIDAGVVNYNSGYVPPLSVVKSGRVKSLNGDTIVVALDEGGQDEYNLTPYMVVSKGGKSVSVSDLRLGDRVKLYLDDAHSNYISKIAIQVDSMLVDGIYKGELDAVDLISGNITLKGSDIFRNTSWENYRYKLTLAINEDTPIYYKGSPVTPDRLKDLHMGKTLYVAAVNDFSRERAVRIVVKSGSEAYYDDKISEINWGSGEFELDNKKNIITNEGTIYLDNRRLVDMDALEEDYSVYVVADKYNGYNNGIFIAVNTPLQVNYEIYVGRLNEIRSDEFDVNYYSKLTDNEWEELSGRKDDITFSYDNDTVIKSVYGGIEDIDARDFFHGDYADDGSSKSEDDYYAYVIVEDDYARVIRVSKGGVIEEDDEISNSTLEELRITKGEIDAIDDALSLVVLENTQNWSPFYEEWQQADADQYVNTEKAIIYKNGRVIGQDSLRAGDVLYIIRDDNRGIIIIVE